MMSKNLKIFLIVFLISLTGWWGANLLQQNMEGFFYWQEVSRNPEIYLAQINLKPRVKKSPIELETQPSLEIEAESGIAVLITPEGDKKTLFKKNISQRRPIASLTKLMTALIVQETYSPDQIFNISKEAVKQEEEKGKLKIGENLSLKELLHIMLIESSNDAAWAIAEGRVIGQEDFLGKERFVELMNLKAKEIGLKNTSFINPTGLDGFENYSTSEDLVKFAHYLIENYPQIFEITKKQSYEVLNPDSSLHHFISENTNKLLGEIPGIIGGKTGFTDEAGGCILLILRGEDGSCFLNVILGTKSSESRFQEMKKLVDFCKETI